MAKNKFNYATKDQLPESIERKDVKIRISIMLDGDVLDHFREQSRSTGAPYQTLINRKLREEIGRGESISKRVEVMEKLVFEMSKTLKKSEASSASGRTSRAKKAG
jgi:hypothetical protein